ncbi:hypothetical protein C8Q72DRAFT_344277 [Fomitopsis betulina]|nr:hypothetical protein C8Q72DRAFT_344277 [Fomitopsis betulina]
MHIRDSRRVFTHAIHSRYCLYRPSLPGRTDHYTCVSMSAQENAKIYEMMRQLKFGEGRTVEELMKSDDQLKGAEAGRLRDWFSGHRMVPGTDLKDEFGRATFFGLLDVLQVDIIARTKKHAASGESDPHAATVRDIYNASQNSRDSSEHLQCL